MFPLKQPFYRSGFTKTMRSNSNYLFLILLDCTTSSGLQETQDGTWLSLITLTFGFTMN